MVENNEKQYNKNSVHMLALGRVHANEKPEKSSKTESSKATFV